MSTYYLSFDDFLLDNFRDALKAKTILPGRVILKEDIDARFDVLAEHGLETMTDLTDALKTKKKLAAFADKSGLSEEYLTILRREANSYKSKPVNLKDLPTFHEDAIEVLDSAGIRNTVQFFEKAAKKTDRLRLAKELNLELSALNELIQLTDLVRITGVGPVFAGMLHEAGITSVEQFMDISRETLCEEINGTIRRLEIKSPLLTPKDMDYCLSLSRDLPIVVEM